VSGAGDDQADVRLSRSARRRNTARYIAIAFGCAVFLLPLLFMISGAVRLPGLPPPDGFEWFPWPPEWSNFRAVFGFIPLHTYMLNSLIVVTFAVPITVVVASMAGFAIARAAPRVRKWLIGASIAALMVPATALWIPRFAMMRWLGLADTLVPLILPALMATSPFYVLLFALVYSRLPRSVFEAAELDGLGPWASWRLIAWPLSRATVFAVAVLAFVVHWSNLLDAVLYLSSPENFTAPLGLRALQSLEPTNHPILLAAATMVALVPVLAFLAIQRALFSRALDV
jgi:multiple sugar transport system permease protein